MAQNMFYKQLAGKDSALSYLFGCRNEGKAIAVDVVSGDEEWFIREARKADVAISHVIDTHLHTDHYSGGKKLAQIVDIPYCLHESNTGWARFNFSPLRDEQLIDLGGLTVRILHTPGHTPDSICLLATDKRNPEVPWFVMTGDTLFVGATGRPDVFGTVSDMAIELFDSLHGKLLSLPDAVTVLPGHHAGEAGEGHLPPRRRSTIGFEKRWNRRLSMGKEAFVESLLKDTLPRPPEMSRIVAVNIAA